MYIMQPLVTKTGPGPTQTVRSAVWSDRRQLSPVYIEYFKCREARANVMHLLESGPMLLLHGKGIFGAHKIQECTVPIVSAGKKWSPGEAV